MSHVIRQYLGSRERFQVVSGGSEVTIQFQSDPNDSSFILSQGFLIHYRGEYTPRSWDFIAHIFLYSKHTLGLYESLCQKLNRTNNACHLYRRSRTTLLYLIFCKFLSFRLVQRLSRTTRALPSLKLSLAGSARPTPPL